MKAIIKKYTIKVVVDEEDRHSMTRQNDGFNYYELVGVLNLVLKDLEDVLLKGKE